MFNILFFLFNKVKKSDAKNVDDAFQSLKGRNFRKAASSKSRNTLF